MLVGRGDEIDENGDAIQADECRDGFDAADENLRAERQAYVGADFGDADGREQETEAAADERLDQVAFRKGRDQRQAKDGKPEVLDRSEGQSYGGEWRGKEQEAQCADHAANDGGEAGERDREIAIAALGHGIAVKGRRDGGRRAGSVEEDG